MAETRMIAGDCMKEMAKLPEGSVDLVFADPPFNIGVKYDEHGDNMPRGEYFHWTAKWLEAATDALSEVGAIWIAINDDHVSTVDQILTGWGLTRRSWVVWKYAFGVHCERKFGRDHTHLLYFTHDPNLFTFNADEIRVPSARQAYGDKRANPKGRVPGDVWEFPRVCGTFKERCKWHPCQMPEAILERIILACSNPGDTVLDPFLGSGTTLAVAKRLGRDGIGFDVSEDYVARARERVTGVTEEPQ